MLSQLLTSYIRFGLVLQLSWNPVPYQLEPCSNLSGTGFQLSDNNTIKAKMHKRSKHIAGYTLIGGLALCGRTMCKVHQSDIPQKHVHHIMCTHTRSKLKYPDSLYLCTNRKYSWLFRCGIKIKHISLHKIGCIRQCASKLALRSFALSLHKIGCIRQYASKLVLHPFAPSFQEIGCGQLQLRKYAKAAVQ